MRYRALTAILALCSGCGGEVVSPGAPTAPDPGEQANRPPIVSSLRIVPDSPRSSRPPRSDELEHRNGPRYVYAGDSQR